MSLEILNNPLIRNSFDKILGENSPNSESVNNDPFFNNSINEFSKSISNGYANTSPFGEKSLFYKKNINGIVYNLQSSSWKYEIVTSTKGTELIEKYAKYDEKIDLSKGKYDDDTDLIIYIEESSTINGYTIDNNDICLIRLSPQMLNEYFTIIKSNPQSSVLENWSNFILQQQKSVNNINFTKEKLIEAFKMEIAYRPLKNISVEGAKYTQTELTNTILDSLSEAFRKLKTNRETWDPSLKSDKYFLKNSGKTFRFFNDQIKNAFKVLKTVENIITFFEFAIPLEKSFFKSLKIFINSFQASLQTLQIHLSSLEKSSPYLFAFICGLWDGTIEFFAGILDMILLVFKLYFQLNDLTAEDKLIYLKLKEGVIEFIENYIKDPEFLQKAFTNALSEYLEERYSNAENAYIITHNAGEDFIVVLDIIISVIEVVKSLADVGKVLPKFENWIDEAFERNKNLEKKLDEINSLKGNPEKSVSNTTTDNLLEEVKKKPTAKERVDIKKRKRSEKINEKYNNISTKRRITFRNTNKIIRKIESELSTTRNIYQRQRRGLDFKKVQNHWYYGEFANKIKKKEISIEDIKILSEVKDEIHSVSKLTPNVAKGEMEIWYNGEIVFAKYDYWANASKENLIQSKKGIDNSLEKVPRKYFGDSQVVNKRNGYPMTRSNDSEVKITSVQDEDIAMIATKLKVNIKDFEIKSRIYTTFDPCNICKRELLIRSRIFPNIEYEIIRPFYKDEFNNLKPVINNETFVIFKQQNNL